MKLIKQLRNAQRTDERAVSPVIGVILMVAITVILAAVIGTFVLDLGQSVGDTGPTASLSISDAETNFDPGTSGFQDGFVLEHQGGDEFDLETTRITVRNVSNNNVLMEWDGTDGITENTASWDIEYNNDNIDSGATETMSSGDVIVLEIDTSGSTPPDEGFDYKILITDTSSSSSVAQATVELS